jgi:hypothetical protein
VNFFTAADPLPAVGFVIGGATPARYNWHCYLDDPATGSAPDIAVAEAELRQAIARRRRDFLRSV